VRAMMTGIPPSPGVSIIPTALGVNPSLTISALSLRIADQINSGIALNEMFLV
jgi:hypothetical protein